MGSRRHLCTGWGRGGARRRRVISPTGWARWWRRVRAIFIAVVYVLYRIANGIYVHKLRIINQHWYEYLKLVNKKLPEATTNEVYASLVNVLLNKLGNMTFEASKAKSGVPPELRYPLSRSEEHTSELQSLRHL